MKLLDSSTGGGSGATESEQPEEAKPKIANGSKENLRIK
jgi:hypothetical protein